MKDDKIIGEMVNATIIHQDDPSKVRLSLDIDIKLVEALASPVDQEGALRLFRQRLTSSAYMVEMGTVLIDQLRSVVERTQPDGTVRPLSDQEGTW